MNPIAVSFVCLFLISMSVLGGGAEGGSSSSSTKRSVSADRRPASSENTIPPSSFKFNSSSESHPFATHRVRDATGKKTEKTYTYQQIQSKNPNIHLPAKKAKISHQEPTKETRPATPSAALTPSIEEASSPPKRPTRRLPSLDESDEGGQDFSATSLGHEAPSASRPLSPPSAATSATRGNVERDEINVYDKYFGENRAEYWKKSDKEYRRLKITIDAFTYKIDKAKKQGAPTKSLEQEKTHLKEQKKRLVLARAKQRAREEIDPYAFERKAGQTAKSVLSEKAAEKNPEYRKINSTINILRRSITRAEKAGRPTESYKADLQKLLQERSQLVAHNKVERAANHSQAPKNIKKREYNRTDRKKLVNNLSSRKRSIRDNLQTITALKNLASDQKRSLLPKEKKRIKKLEDLNQTTRKKFDEAWVTYFQEYGKKVEGYEGFDEAAVLAKHGAGATAN